MRQEYNPLYDPKSKEEFDKLKANLLSNNSLFKPYGMAFHYIQKMEEDIEKLTEMNKKYQDFFNLLNELIPKHLSIHDRIY